MKSSLKNRTIFTRDNLEVMRGMADECIDLIYLDPPFNSNHDYAAPIGSQAAGAEFKDTWTLDEMDDAWHGEIAEEHPGLYGLLTATENIHGKSMKAYLIYMAVRIMEMKRILRPTGSIYLHCDPTASHYLKLLMDEVFGKKNFKREIIWNLQTASGYKSQVKGYIRGHDTVLYYVADEHRFVFHKQFREHKPEYIARFKKKDSDGRLYRDDRSGGRRQYLDTTQGTALTDVWSDIMSFQQNSTATEYVGYPTQKPLALLERIIKASSNGGDVVLDPFCGCATACVAAEKLDRQWIGIDVSPLAARLVQERIERELGVLLFDPVHRTDIPLDRGGERSKNIKHILYGVQEGICNGCQIHFPYVNLTVDHIVPKSKGGADVDENLQLLCARCNSVKGNRTQEYLISQVRMIA